MRGRIVARVLKFIVFGVAIAGLLGYVVMSLWNRLTPAIFGWHIITFWQALGLLVLSRILFGGIFRRGGGWGPGMGWRRRMMERWEKMTPEEREKFRSGMRGRCGPFGSAPPATPPTAEAKS